ncbi:TPA: hypothetical protein ACLBZ1_003413 [Bacillus cereus]
MSNPVNEVKDRYSHNHRYYYETKLESLGDTALEIVLKEIHNKALKKASTDDAPNSKEKTMTYVNKSKFFRLKSEKYNQFKINEE